MTVGEILAAAQAHGFADDTAVLQRTIVNLLHKQICAKRRWSWLETVSTLTTAANDPTLSLAALTDLRAATEIDAVSVEGVGGIEELPMEYIEPAELRYRLQSDGADLPATSQQVGIPRCWSVIAGELNIWPIPDAEYTLNVQYLRSASTLDDDADVPLIPVDHCPVLVHGLVEGLAARNREWDLRNSARQDKEEVIRELEVAEGMRQRSNAGRVRSSGFHQAAEVGSDWEY